MGYFVWISFTVLIWMNVLNSITMDTKSQAPYEDEFIPQEDMKLLRKRKKPEKCYGTDRVLDRRCCVFPPFYKAEVARKCGAQMSIADQHMKDNITTIRRQFPQDSKFWRCVLYEYDIMNADNETLSLDRFYEHLDRWSDLNPEFKPIMNKAKRYCKINHRFHFPLTYSEYYHYQQCIRNFVRTECPRILESDPICQEQKAFYKECQEFFL